MRILRAIALALGILFLLTLVRLARLNDGGPSHFDFELPGAEPATIYLPGGGNPFFQIFPPPEAKRPPAVVLIHGFMADRQTMSVLARRIAQNGYAVLAIDVSGHGANRNPFVASFGVGGTLDPDVKRAVDFLRSYPRVDGSKIVVMGHSMGAGAALDYATSDPNLMGAVMISGGFGLAGSVHPKNSLFIFAQHDPEFIRTASLELAAHLAGVAQVDLGKTYGDFSAGTAVEALQVAGVDHVQIVYSEAAAGTIIRWLDSTFATARTTSLDLRDARRRASAIALVLFVILLIPIGRICGGIAGAWPERPAGAQGWIGLAIVAAAALAAMPLVAMIPPAAFIAMVVGDIQVSWLAVAGVILLGVLALRDRLDGDQILERLGATLFAAALGFAVIYISIGATSITFHRMAFTPERLLFFALGSALIYPFWLGFELLVRRGGVAISTLMAALGRILILLLVVLGVAVGVLPEVIMLVLPFLVLEFAMIEIFAASAYSTSRNLNLIALVESAWFVFMIAATAPITFMF